MKATVWSKDQCPFCDQVKLMLDIKKIPYEEKKIGVNASKEDLLEAVPTAKSVPQVFLDDEYIGGFKELKERLTHAN